MTFFRYAVVSSALLVAACGAAPESVEQGDVPASSSDAIKGGQRADAYPEAVLVGMVMRDTGKTYRCSGVVIAPTVVLTAGHCLGGFESFTVTAPFAGGQKANVTESFLYDWPDVLSPQVLTDKHDVGILQLDRAIELDRYPTVATKPLRSGQKLVNVGRVQDGTVSNDWLFVGPPRAVSSGASKGFPFTYGIAEVTEAGDSGGPAFAVSSTGEHVVVGVESGGVTGTDLVARVDLVASWIRSRVAAAN